MSVSDLEHFLEDTRGGNIDQLEAWLRVLYRDPPNDAAWLPHLEALLADDRPCVVAIPYHYGEIRWLAAQALAATREQLGIRDPVRVEGVVLPMSSDELSRTMEDAGIGYPRTKSRLEYFVDLREAGKLTLVDLDLVGAGSLIPWRSPENPTGGYALTRRARG